jgi:hypothetical protein
MMASGGSTAAANKPGARPIERATRNAAARERDAHSAHTHRRAPRRSQSRITRWARRSPARLRPPPPAPLPVDVPQRRQRGESGRFECPRAAGSLMILPIGAYEGKSPPKVGAPLPLGRDAPGARGQESPVGASTPRATQVSHITRRVGVTIPHPRG